MPKATRHPSERDWQGFVLEHGFRASAHDLSVVLGRTADEVERVRRTGACKRLSQPKDFGELYTLWHGRAPEDSEWPVPVRAGQSSYLWQAPELALLASLVGQLGTDDIAHTLTMRLRERTGDARATRTRHAVQGAIQRIGMQSADVIGGVTVSEATRELGSRAVLYHAIRTKALPTFPVGRLLVIPHDAWTKWKAERQAVPDGYIRLSTIRQALAIRSDKLSEYSRMGLIPGAIRIKPFGSSGPSTQFGTWYIDAKVAKQLIEDRRAGRPMPWHGKGLLDNLKVTHRLWRKRKHPASCKTCAEIWGTAGAPRSFDDYVRRYPPLAHGAKRHLTRPYSPGLTLAQVAEQAGCSVSRVRRAIRNGALAARPVGRHRYVTRTDATRWIARHMPTGDGDRSWISLETARKQYLFSITELQVFIRSGKLKSKVGDFGAARGIVYVARHQVGQLREAHGFTERQAARRLGVTVARLRSVMAGVDWRRAEKIPLVTVQAIGKRLASKAGYSFEEAAIQLEMPLSWVMARRDDGTIHVSRAPWDGRRLYISEPMMKRLEKAKAKSESARPRPRGPNWLRLSDAAREAGVCTATVQSWGTAGEVDRQPTGSQWWYARQSVRARARRYWENVRFRRAVPPEWLGAEHTAHQASA